MKKGYTIENWDLSYVAKNNILVLNYQYINIIQNLPCVDNSSFLKDKKTAIIGVWKIKYKLLNFQLN